MITKIPSNFLTLEFARNHYLTLQCTKEKPNRPLSETAIKERNALSLNNEQETRPSPMRPFSLIYTHIFIFFPGVGVEK